MTLLFLLSLDFGLYSGVLYDALINAPQRHIAKKSPVETLTIYRCDTRADRVDNLKKHVQEFSWDGDEERSYKGRERYDTGSSL